MLDALEIIGMFLIVTGLALSWRYGAPKEVSASEPPLHRMDARVGGILILVGVAFTARRVFES